MRHLPELSPDLLLEIGTEQHHVVPSRFMTKSPDFVETDACCGDLLMDLDTVRTLFTALAVLSSVIMPECAGKVCGYRCQHPVISRYGRNFTVNADHDPFPVVSFHNQMSCNTQI